MIFMKAFLGYSLLWLVAFGCIGWIVDGLVVSGLWSAAGSYILAGYVLCFGAAALYEIDSR